MLNKFTILGSILISSFTVSVSAQSSASIENNSGKILNADEFSIGHDEWTFYLDQENKVYYIDFESINVNLSDIKVVNDAGEVVISDKLWDLPVNTIYELNVHDLTPGKYKIELRSYTGLIQKEITLSE